MNVTNKIVPIGMLTIILVSMFAYVTWAVDEITAILAPAEMVELPIQDEAQDMGRIQLETTDQTQTSNSALLSQAKAIIDRVKSTIETRAELITYRESYIEMNTLFEHFCGESVFVDEEQRVVKLQNDYLAFLYAEADTTEPIQNLIELKDYLEEQDTPLLYVQAPYKISKYDSQLPTGVTDGSNAAADSLLAGIDGYVDYIDLREVMYASGMNQYDYFFKTDHHWLPETGLWAAGVIAQCLNDNYDFEIDMDCFVPENYHVEVYEDWFLGSQGKRVGQHLVGTDDISLITPTFETDFIFDVPSKDIHREGAFDVAMFDYDLLLEKDYFNLNSYAAYTGGDYPLNTIVNRLNPAGSSILVIRDSFAGAMTPFLALGCSELDTIDLRCYKEQSLMDYLDEHEGEYDLVMFLYNPSLMIESEDTFVFDEVVP